MISFCAQGSTRSLLSLRSHNGMVFNIHSSAYLLGLRLSNGLHQVKEVLGVGLPRGTHHRVSAARLGVGWRGGSGCAGDYDVGKCQANKDAKILSQHEGNYSEMWGLRNKMVHALQNSATITSARRACVHKCVVAV